MSLPVRRLWDALWTASTQHPASAPHFRPLRFEPLEGRALLAPLAELVEDNRPSTTGGINHQGASSNPIYLRDVNGTLYFRAADTAAVGIATGEELWRVNAAGQAELVEDGIAGGGINPGAGSSAPSNLAVVGGTLYFQATDGTNGRELWRINPVSGLAEMVEDAIPGGGINPLTNGNSSPIYMTDVAGVVYFQATDGSSGIELWRVNSINGLAERVEDTLPATSGGINPLAGSSGPNELTAVGSMLFFRANDGTNGNELWRVPNGGQAVMVEDSIAGGGINSLTNGNSNPLYLTNFGGTLYFQATDGANGFELWRVTGTGTAVMVEDGVAGGGIRPLSGNSYPKYLTISGGTLFFRATDGTNGNELWRIDNGTGQAVMVEDGVPGGGINVTTNGDSNPVSLTDVNGTLYFQATNGFSGFELWRVTGAGQAVMVEDTNPNTSGGINPLAGNSFPINIRNVNGTPYFQASDGTNGFELWRVNAGGQAEMVEDNLPNTSGGIHALAGGSYPTDLTVVGATLFFRALDGINGDELWHINAAGQAEMVEDNVPGGGIFPSNGSSSPVNLRTAGGTLYFQASDGTNGFELWRVVTSVSLSATLSGGNLTITDTVGKNNQLTISILNGNYVITDANEQFASAPSPGVLSNGNKTLTIPLASVTGSVLVQGQGGQDTVTLNGTGGADVLVLSPGSGIWDGEGYLVYLLAIENVSSAGGTNDAAYFYDGPGVDTFVATPTSGVQTGAGYQHQVTGFGLVNGVGVAGGQDVAYLYGNTGNDTFVGRVPDFHMVATGYRNQAISFESVTAVANGGANDVAYMYGSSGDDTFVATETNSFLAASTHFLQALGFDEVVGVAGAGGIDVTHFYDTAVSDVFVGQVGNSFFSGNGKFYRALGFRTAHFYATNGALDEANLYDSPGSDVFAGQGQEGRLFGPNYDLFAHGFGAGDTVRAIKTQGGTDDVQLGAVDYLFQQIGAWV